MDIDPCTGKVTDRIIAATGLRGGRNEQNKFEYRSDIFSGYAREYRVVAEIDGVPKTRITKNGLLAGTYVQPINVWVHAEQVIPGVPPPANDFSQMPWLTRGVGIDENGNLWGPLDPFPQTGVLIEPPQCGPVSALNFEGDNLNATWVPACKFSRQQVAQDPKTKMLTRANSTTSEWNCTFEPKYKRHCSLCCGYDYVEHFRCASQQTWCAKCPLACSRTTGCSDPSRGCCDGVRQAQFRCMTRKRCCRVSRCS